MTYAIRATVWRHPGADAWHFVTLPEDVADEISARSARAPFGTVPVEATIGETTWRTSLFADTKAASYLLPVKADVRRREELADGDEVAVRVTLLAGPLG